MSIFQPIATIVINFYRSYDRVTMNGSVEFAVTKATVDRILWWLVMSTDVFTSAPESTQINLLKRMCIAVYMATSLCDCVCVAGCIKPADLRAHERNFFNVATVLREALFILESSLFMAESIRSIEQRKRPVMKKIKGVLCPTDSREEVKSGLARFSGGSREWLHAEVLRWLDDSNGSAAPDKHNSKLFWLKMLPGTIYILGLMFEDLLQIS